jgi:hypothetical protein
MFLDYFALGLLFFVVGANDARQVVGANDARQAKN